MADERVFENLIMLAHSSRRDAGVVGDRGEINLLAAGEAGDFKEPGKVLNGPDQCFGLNLFAEISPEVGFQVLLVAVGINDRGQAAAIESIA